MEEGGLQSGHTSSIIHPLPQERGADKKPPGRSQDIGVGNEKGGEKKSMKGKRKQEG